MSAVKYEAAKRSVEALDPADQLRLVAELTARLNGEASRPVRSLLELEGLGAEIWREIDVDEYIRQERASWGG
jgi:hypothetical protein